MTTPDQTRNLNPTPAARVAMIIWGNEYSEQRGGSMDFWDNLDSDRRKRCEMVVKKLGRAQDPVAQKLVEALELMVAEKVDYMIVNNLGIPEEQHTIKQANAALTRARGEGAASNNRGNPMSVTEEEAKEKICCGPIPNARLRGDNCIGSACMAWRWSSEQPHQDTDHFDQVAPPTVGYCALTGREK